MKLTNLILSRWQLDGKTISEEGVALNKDNEIVLFTLAEKVRTATELTSIISFTHSQAAVGNLQCKAMYSTGFLISLV